MRKVTETHFNNSLVYATDCLFAVMHEVVAEAEQQKPDIRNWLVDHLLQRVAEFDKRLVK